MYIYIYIYIYIYLCHILSTDQNACMDTPLLFLFPCLCPTPALSGLHNTTTHIWICWSLLSPFLYNCCQCSRCFCCRVLCGHSILYSLLICNLLSF